MVAKVSAFKPLDSVMLERLEVFKGRIPSRVTIRAGQSDCDFFLPPLAPKIGDEYLLYLRESGGQLTTTRCMPGTPAAASVAELRELRKQRQAECKGPRSRQLMVTLLSFNAVCEAVSPETGEARASTLREAKEVFPRCFDGFGRDLQKRLAEIVRQVEVDEIHHGDYRSACETLFGEERYRNSLVELRLLRDDPSQDFPRR